MARTAAANFTGPLQFPYATAATDLVKQEDVQTLAVAVDSHDHSTGKGLVLAAGAIPSGLITSAMIADGTIDTVDLKDASVTMVKLLAGAATLPVGAGGAAGTPTTTSTTMVDMPDMTETWTANGGYVVAWLTASVYNQSAGAAVLMAISRAGVDGPASSFTSNAINSGGTMSIVQPYGPLSGSQTIKGRWSVSSGTGVSPGVARSLMIVEFRR